MLEEFAQKFVKCNIVLTISRFRNSMATCSGNGQLLSSCIFFSYFFDWFQSVKSNIASAERNGFSVSFCFASYYVEVNHS